MKISLNYKHIMACFVVIAASTFQSCDDKETYDVVGNPANIIYINTLGWVPNKVSNNQNTFSVVHTPIGDFGNVLAKIPLRSTKPMSKTTSVKAELDNSLIEVYNKTYGTTCVALPEGVIDLSKAMATISEGKYLSGDSVTISIDKSKLALLTQKAYLIPVKLTSSSDPGSQVSSDYGTAYIIINTSKTLIKDNVGSAAMLGSLVTNYSTFTVTSDPASTRNTFTNVFDGSTSTNWQFGTSPVTLVIDMKELKKVGGLRLYAQYASYGYVFNKVQVSSSKDNVTFEEIGTCTNTTMANESGYQYIGFYAATEARYVKLSLNWSSSYRYICELGIYLN